MIVSAIVVTGLAYLAYREYKSGKLQKIAEDIQAKITALSPVAGAVLQKVETDAKSAVSAVEAEAKKVL